MIRIKKTKTSRISQGDIFRNVDLIEYVVEKDGVIEVSKINFPFVIVLTQDCELQQDYSYRSSLDFREQQNKLLMSVLVAPLYSSDQVFSGEHLSDLGITVSTINKKSTEGKYLLNNERPRYHYLEFPDDVPISSSIVDFKHYFSLNVELLRKEKKKKFVCKVSELYREDLSLRFANYLSRIGLPEISDFPKISVAAMKALHNAKISKLSQLTGFSRDTISALEGMDSKSLKKLELSLADRKLSFKA